ncbi:hypothetical protein ACH41H_12870 [Streptomyces sp. NPDC020800]|uniref:hypothetical protein n=1 Tax=Streptomyces sp. NPDC020800 TaxID=3365092 RepID=UPI0037AA417F
MPLPLGLGCSSLPDVSLGCGVPVPLVVELVVPLDVEGAGDVVEGAVLVVGEGGDVVAGGALGVDEGGGVGAADADERSAGRTGRSGPGSLRI